MRLRAAELTGIALGALILAATIIGLTMSAGIRRGLDHAVTVAAGDHTAIAISLSDSVYHLNLQRTIKHATLLPARTGGDAIAMFIVDKLEAVANLKQALVRYAAENPGYRVTHGRFMEIRLATAVPKGRLHAIYYLGAFIAELQASGFVADALERSGQQAAVAPL